MTTTWSPRATRRARPSSAVWNVTKTLAQTAVFWTVFLLLIPQMLAAAERSVGITRFAFPATIAWTVFALASTLGLTSGVAMAVHGEGTPLPLDAPRKLVARGPYRYVRNPMAIAGLTQGAAVACLLGSWAALAFVGAGFIVWNYIVRPIEEADLELQFGEEYRSYLRSVRCWFPRFPGYSSGADAD